MNIYRVGGHWGRTIIKVGTLPADEHGRRPDDELVGLMDSPELAARVCELFNMLGDGR